MANQTGIAVGCAVGIPVFFALLVAFYFFLKTRRRFAREDLEDLDDEHIQDVNMDLSYDNIEGLQIPNKTTGPFNQDCHLGADLAGPSSTSSDDGKTEKHNEVHSTSPSPAQDSRKQKRFVPAYRKQLKSSMALGSSSRNSSFSNLHNSNNSGTIQGSNTSINSSNTNTDFFYSDVVPVLDVPDTPNKVQKGPGSLNDSSSIDLARTLQQPTPSFNKRPQFSRSSSVNLDEVDYVLKNNYDLSNNHEIQEEDQYENEFTNYTESKREYIDSLRPKPNQPSDAIQ